MVTDVFAWLVDDLADVRAVRAVLIWLYDDRVEGRHDHRGECGRGETAVGSSSSTTSGSAVTPSASPTA